MWLDLVLGSFRMCIQMCQQCCYAVQCWSEWQSQLMLCGIYSYPVLLQKLLILLYVKEAKYIWVFCCLYRTYISSLGARFRSPALSYACTASPENTGQPLVGSFHSPVSQVLFVKLIPFLPTLPPLFCSPMEPPVMQNACWNWTASLPLQIKLNTVLY